MPADPVLVLAWLVLAHLVGDFVLQNEQIVSAKTDDGMRGVLGIVVHSAVIGLCLIPFGLAYGVDGWKVVVFVTITHGLVDRIKVILTRRAEAQALEAARRRTSHAGAILGPAWTPVPGILFIFDQLAHLAILVFAWKVFLATAVPTDAWVQAVNRAVAGADPATVNRIALTTAVITSLVIANVRGGLFFVATLVHPREMVEGTEIHDPAPKPEPPAPEPTRAWRLRLGPLEARVEAENGGPHGATAAPAATGDAARAANGAPASAPTRKAAGSPARVGATIGVLERLLIVIFMLTGSEAAIGFVVTAKTLARFKQLDDRDFAEYYLLGTLASVGVAISTGLLGRAALGTLG